MSQLKDWLQSATIKLTEAGIPSPTLDAELILSHVLEKPRTYLHAHEDYTLSKLELSKANKILKKRIARVPLAYIVKEKEFYGRNFIVSSSVLIPRPESEDIIEIVKKIAHPGDKIVDVGTGSGCLGITIKLELPQTKVCLLDKSSRALRIADKNARNLGADFKMIRSDLLKKYNDKTDIIVANLPYVNKDWDVSPETSYEPKLALFAKDNGLILIKKLIEQSTTKLKSGGFMVLEADPEQHEEIINFASKYNLKHVETIGYIVTLKS